MPTWTKKQKEYGLNANHRWNVKLGAVRSGKTFQDKEDIIPRRIRERANKDGLVFIIGVTEATVERNVLRPMRDKFGNNLVGTIDKNKVWLFGEECYCLGAEKINQVAKIQGASIKYLYGDEVVKWNKEVFDMIKSRLDQSYSCADLTGNPEHKKHWFKEFIESNADIYLQHYTIDDNDFLSTEFKENLKKEYEGTILYNRYILGQWCNAEGIIYVQFANNTDLFMKDEAVNENGNKINFMIISIGIDYGATKGETEFKATGITPLFKEAWTIDEEKITGLYAPEDFYKAFINFYKRVVSNYGKVTHAFADYGALGQVLTFGLNRRLQQERIPLQVQDCIKGRIIDRIYLDTMLFAQGRRFILKKCKYMKEAYEQALWDDKKEDERLDDGTTPVDDLDASEYSMFPFYDKFMSNIGGY